MAVTAANVLDSQLFEALLDELPAIRTPSGQRRSPTWQGLRRQGL
jgi:hypothetical protein